MPRVLTILMPLVAAVASLPASAGQQEGEPPPIIVDGERAQGEAALTDLARDLAGNPRPLRPLARFEQPLCLIIAAEDAELAQDVAARIVENAKLAGVTVQGGGCKPNALVVLTADAHAQLTEIRASGRKLFAGISPRVLDAALGARDPVFVFQSSIAKAASGQDFYREMPDSVPKNFTTSMGRLSRVSREDMLAALVVIETGAVADLSPAQIADYASVRLLAPTGEVDAGEAGAPRTIMTLFVSPTDAPSGMTRFDRAYLKALYELPSGSFASEVLRAAVLETAGEADDEG